MKNKITKFCNDNFINDRPDLILPTTRIFFTIDEGEKYSGYFDIESLDQKAVRGIVYSSSSRMVCKNPGFEGTSSKILFTFDSKGLRSGDIYRGFFTITSDAGEYKIYFTANILSLHAKSSIGNIFNIREFIDLYMFNHEEALKLFMSSKFKDVISNDNDVVKNIYDTLRKNFVTANILEEFLVGISQKKPIKFYTDDTYKIISNINGDINDSFAFKKNGWGYLELSIECDCDFIELYNDTITTDDFVNNTCDIRYKINFSKLHRGKNEGNIIIKSHLNEYKYNIVVNSNENIKKIKYINNKKTITLKAIEKYLQYKAGNISAKEMCDDVVLKVDKLSHYTNDAIIYDLVKAYIYLLSQKKTEALELLEKYSKKSQKKHNRDINILYEYLQQLYNSEYNSRIKFQEQINKAFSENPNNPNLLWLLVDNDEYYIQNPDAKYDILEKSYNNKVTNFLTMLEAYLLLKNQPELTETISDFKIDVLLFARRKKILDKNFAIRISSILSKYNTFDIKIFEILKYCYEITLSTETLSAICRYLIANSKTENKYFRWYNKGIQEKLHITNLYEFYLYSLDDRSVVRLDESIYLYFSKSNVINNKKKSFLYASLIQDKNKYPEILKIMSDEISIYALDQLKKRNIDKNLKIIYKYFLPKWKLGKSEIDSLSEIAYTKEIIVAEPKIVRVIVIYNNLVSTQTYNVNNSYAYIKIFTPEDKILLEDNKGNIYINSSDYSINSLLLAEEYSKYLNTENNHYIGTLLNEYNNSEINDKNYKNFELLTDSMLVKDSVKKNIKKMLLQYYYNVNDKLNFNRIMQGINVDWLDVKERNELVKGLLGMGEIKRVSNIISMYGYDNFDANIIFEYLKIYLSDINYKKDDYIVDICYYVLSKGMYDKNILEYLCNNYINCVDRMVNIWQIASKENINTSKLEENILIQMLFTEEVKNEEDIFYNYYINGGNNNAIKSYLSYKSNEYFSKNIDIQDKFFEYIETEYARGVSINPSCKLAFLKRYSTEKNIPDNIKKMIVDFIIELRARGYIFDFFNKYDLLLDSNINLKKSTIIQYHTNNNVNVIIYYKISTDIKSQNQYIRESIPMFYNGYYQKEFVLFNDETLSYYIVEEADDFSEVSEVNKISLNINVDNEINDKYDYINKIIDSKDVDVLLEEYERRNYLTGQIFQVL